jgi:hypothetical protein
MHDLLSVNSSGIERGNSKEIVQFVEYVVEHTYENSSYLFPMSFLSSSLRVNDDRLDSYKIRALFTITSTQTPVIVYS